MSKPFDVKMIILGSDGPPQVIEFNLLDIKCEFACPICASIGEDENISLQSLSDHMARHYVENNRAVEINTAVVHDIMTNPVSQSTYTVQPSTKLPALTPISSQYDDAVERRFTTVGLRVPRDEKIHYDDYVTCLEQQALEKALAESLLESTTIVPPHAEPIVPPQVIQQVVPPQVVQHNELITEVPTLQREQTIVYPPRKKKENPL